MNKNGVLNVIYGIAVFVAFVSAVALLYGAIELLCNTTFYTEKLPLQITVSKLRRAQFYNVPRRPRRPSTDVSLFTK